MRYAIVQDPWGSFLVFDDETNMPVEIDGEPLYGLSRQEAEAAAARADASERAATWRRIKAA